MFTQTQHRVDCRGCPAPAYLTKKFLVLLGRNPLVLGCVRSWLCLISLAHFLCEVPANSWQAGVHAHLVRTRVHR